jgi:Uma2 family endonuclease
MASRAPAFATFADLEALPATVKGEIIQGALYTHPRPRSRHQQVILFLSDDLGGPYARGRGGPGGWWILPEPGITLPGSDEFSPDIAGWRRDRLPELPEDRTIDVAPDWVCEILSPRTRAYDLRTKKPFYASIGVHHIWYVDLDMRSLTVSRLHDGRWLEVGLFGDDDVVLAEPFDAAAIELVEWWPAPREA